MPIISDDLLLALKNKNHQHIMNAIQANGDLVNSLNKNGLSLFQILLMTVRPQDKLPGLVEFIIKHSLFKLNVSVEGQLQSNLQSIITSARIDVLLLIKDQTQMVFTENKLSYELAAKTLALAKKVLYDAQNQGKDKDLIERATFRKSNLEKVVALLNDVSTLYAINKDDKSIMEALQKAGARAAENLSATAKPAPAPATKTASASGAVKPATNKQFLPWFSNAQALLQQHAEQRAKSASMPAAGHVTSTPANAAKPAPTPATKTVPASGAAKQATPAPANSVTGKSTPAPAAKPIPASGAAEQAPNYSTLVENMGLLAELERQQQQLEANYNNARANLYKDATKDILDEIDKLLPEKPATNKQFLPWFSSAQALLQQHAEQRAKSASASMPAAGHVTSTPANAAKPAPTSATKTVPASGAVKPAPFAPANSVAGKSAPAPTAQPVPASGGAKQAPYSPAQSEMSLWAELERRKKQMELNYIKDKASLFKKATQENLGVLNSLIAGANGYN